MHARKSSSTIWKLQAELLLNSVCNGGLDLYNTKISGMPIASLEILLLREGPVQLPGLRKLVDIGIDLRNAAAKTENTQVFTIQVLLEYHLKSEAMLRGF